MGELVSSEDIVRARHDPAFRQQLLAVNLERLLHALNLMRRIESKNPKTDRQMREGVDLAVKLADRLQEMGVHPGPRAA